MSTRSGSWAPTQSPASGSPTAVPGTSSATPRLPKSTAATWASSGLAWSYRTNTTRGLEATPLVVDGVLYMTSTWSVVLALDAKTGALRWQYDPKVPRSKGRDACCDVVNRGVAAWKGLVYVGTLDGRLVAIDADTGAERWSVQTTDPSKPYTITGAPRVLQDLVVIGNGGADMGVRGYVSAYDAATGALVWRFYTVPGPPGTEPEHPEVALAAKTWSKDSYWEGGLGGTVWDSMAYDPELDLLYVGVGNASVYEHETRSPGGGDNLFLASILALRPKTGKLVWHYQTTPGESWDYTATQHMILAELEIGGRARKVLLQAPKNGFFYVLDRATGELLSAEPYIRLSWASHVDLETGRPVVRPEALWHDKTAFVMPAVVGGHSWHPMSFHPGTGLVYLPTHELLGRYERDPDFEMHPGAMNTGEDWAGMADTAEGFEFLNTRSCEAGRLTAWDPIAGRAAWQVVFDTAISGGVLSTAGGLVFQGNGNGELAAYDAKSGERLWRSDTGVGVMAPPISYRIDGEQYVAVLAGLGGSLGGHFARFDVVNDGRLLVYKLGGKAPMPAVPALPARKVVAERLEVSPETVQRGRTLYATHCARCHGVAVHASGLYPDLRFSSRDTHERWNDIVIGGIRAGGGMASFADVVDAAGARAIQAYVVERALHEPTALESLAAWAAEQVCIPGHLLAD